MLRFFRNHLHYTNELKPEDVGDFFNYSPTLRHGFPQNVSAFAHDYILGLIAVGTRDGQIRVFGAENVEWSSSTPSKSGVSHMYFAVGTGILVVLCLDHSFHKFQIENDVITRSSANYEERLKRITSCEMQNRCEERRAHLLVGTVTGNVFALDAELLELSELIIFEDYATNIFDLNEDARSVDNIAVNCCDSSKLLIVFNASVIVYYDTQTNQALRNWKLLSNITSVAWHFDGVQFICSHSDGQLDMWNINSSDPTEKPFVHFGPYPCMPIRKVLWASALRSDPSIIFYTGGMERATWGDRYTLSVKRTGKEVVFDFGSPVVDFFVVPSVCNGIEPDYSNSIALLVLCQQEFVAIDLTDGSWPVLSLPYLFPIHSSPITTNIHCANIEEHVWKTLTKATEAQQGRKIRDKKSWPIHAGANVKPPAPCASSNTEKRQLLITGHEDGSVKFWAVGSISAPHILTVETAREFSGFVSGGSEQNTIKRTSGVSGDTTNSVDDEENTEWPPFRKVGLYDPFCDDPRLAVQTIHFHPATGQLTVGGRSGHVLVYQLDDEPSNAKTVCRLCIDILEGKKPSNSSKNRSPQALPMRKEAQQYTLGYQLFSTEKDAESCVIQLQPAVPVTAVSSLPTRNLTAAGNEYGFALCDLRTQTVLVQNCLITTEELAESTALSGALSRFKSMKKSIRQSFRRKTKRAAQSVVGSTNERDESFCPGYVDETRPVERQVASRDEGTQNLGDPLQSTVRVIKFHCVSLVSSAPNTDSLWIGTNGGVILVYAIMDDALKPDDACVLVKEVHLQHRAPIIDLDWTSIDGSTIIKSSSNPQRVIVYTEEQIKAFTLPSMKSTRYKCKLTGTEGSRIRKAQLLTLQNASNRNLYEKFLIIITNQGEVLVFLAFSLKRILRVQFTKASDVAGISSAIISQRGELFFLRPGGSEFQRCSLSACSPTNLLSPLRNSGFPRSCS
ncbi:hypothetical protein AB6A40_003932 [Gnathostoma spinigerum]|uniref:Lethal giant larvae homologue 2 domain-containing protein n=1 Tax=Gnathostoma spinigerum TaxID=75299 RepID=A0ABD6EB59_9BILA